MEPAGSDELDPEDEELFWWAVELFSSAQRQQAIIAVTSTLMAFCLTKSIQIGRNNENSQECVFKHISVSFYLMNDGAKSSCKIDEW